MKLSGDIADYALIKAEWFISRLASFDMTKAQSKERVEAIYAPLIEFMRSNFLLSNRDFRVEDWSQFVLMNSDLTEEGGSFMEFASSVG